jgi:hypothetical protein
MINLFQFASNDKSLSYLYQIFGSMNGVINPAGGFVQAGTSVTLLGTMFKTFNSVILAVGALLVVYMTVVGVMATAHEGEFMGKKWNNIWIPIRTVLGIAALVPTGSGYSAIQIIMMWVIVQGIGAADTLWNTVLGYVDIVGSPYGQVTIPSVGAYDSFNKIFQALTCEASARMSVPDPGSTQNGAYFCNKTTGSFCSGTLPVLSPNSGRVTFGPGGSCGTLNYCNVSTACAGGQDSLKCTACQAQFNALGSILTVLSQIANQFVKADYQYREFYYTSFNQPASSKWSWISDYCNAQNPPIPQDQCCVASRMPGQKCKANNGQPGNPNIPSPNEDGFPQNLSDDAVKNVVWPFYIKPILGGQSDFIGTSVSYYTNALGAAASTYIQSLNQNPNNFSGDLDDAAQTGWIFAGSYYYAIANQNSNNLQDSMPTLSGEVKVVSQTQMNNYRNNYTAALALLSAASNAGTGAMSGTPQLNQVSGTVNMASDSSMQAFSTGANPSGGSNPLSALQITGSVLLAVVIVLFAALIGVTLGLGIGGFINVFALGTGATNPVGPTWALIYFLLVPALLGLMGIMITLGGTLAIYVPLIPYVIFTFGAIGWMISTIETMVAGPLVALGILSPSGNHELLGKAEPALMLLFNVFLRPSLMIFGLIAAMLLATVVVKMINYAFWGAVLKGVAGGGAALVNPIELVIYLSAYVSLLVAGLNKCFQAISLIPEGVMRWIGGQGERYGEEAGVGAMKEGVQAGGAGAKGALAGGSTMADRTGAAIKGGKEYEEQKKKTTGVGAGDAEGKGKGG